MRKKIAFLLVALMMFLVPASAFAAGREVSVTNSTEFIAALVDQQDGDVITLAPGVYDIGQGTDQAIEAGPGSMQKGWFIPVIKNDVTIKGAGIGTTTVTSSYTSANGCWASQDFFAIFGDRAIVKDMTIIPKIETNKAIEVMGKDVTLENLAIKSNPLGNDSLYANTLGNGDAQYSGSIYFNPSGNADPAVASAKDVGSALLKNVSLAAHISTGGALGVQEGAITLDKVAIDWTNFPYDFWDIRDTGWKVMSDNPHFVIGDGGFSVDVDQENIDYTRDILSIVPTNTCVNFAPGNYAFEGSVSRPITLNKTTSGVSFDITKLTLAEGGALSIITHPESVVLSTNTMAMVKGTSFKPEVTVLPSAATDKSVAWSSDNSSVASVDGTGLITAVAAGETYINVKTVDGGVSARIKISVSNPKATGVVLNLKSARVKIGQKIALKAFVLPSDVDTSTVTWSSSNSSIASVDSKGVVTARKTGAVTITAKSASNPEHSTSARITIVRPVTKITARKTKVVLRRGTSWNLRVKAYPTNASSRKVYFKSTSKLVKVNSHGTVSVSKKAKHGFKAVITIKAKDGFGATKKVYVTVTKYRP